MTIYTIGLAIGYWHGRSKCAELTECEYRPSSVHYEYNIPDEWLPLFEDEQLNVELVLRDSMCKTDKRCRTIYPMSEDLFAALQLAAYETGTIVSRKIVQ